MKRNTKDAEEERRQRRIWKRSIVGSRASCPRSILRMQSLTALPAYRRAPVPARIRDRKNAGRIFSRQLP